MQFKNNIVINVLKIKLLLKLSKIHKSNKYYEKIINISNKHPNNEKMLFFKINALKKLNRRYKMIESIEKLLKVNPYNSKALFEIADLIQ